MPFDDSDGLRVVLSPPQLAAVLTQDSISESETFANRVWGGLRVAAGVVELLGAGALCAVPEPTMLSKVGCVVFGLHGADNTQAGARQVRTGRSVATVTQSAAQGLARGAGVDDRSAEFIGISVHIAVPLLLGSAWSAARVISLRAGQLRLAAHEVAGGHTIARHVGRTAAELQQRLMVERNLRVASTFLDLSTAERAVSQALRAQSVVVRNWAAMAQAGHRMALTHNAGAAIGHCLVRAAPGLRPTSMLKVVLEMNQHGGLKYYVLTAYPIL